MIWTMLFSSGIGSRIIERLLFSQRFFAFAWQHDADRPLPHSGHPLLRHIPIFSDPAFWYGFDPTHFRTEISRSAFPKSYLNPLQTAKGRKRNFSAFCCFLFLISNSTNIRKAFPSFSPARCCDASENHYNTLTTYPSFRGFGCGASPSG